MKLDARHIGALNEAEARMICCDFCPYLELKTLFVQKQKGWRDRFQTLFMNFYKMRQAHLDDRFSAEFFQILCEGAVMIGTTTDYERVFKKLSGFTRLKGDDPPQFSFVSKLIGMHHEERPLYDRHVRHFFQCAIPSPKTPEPERITAFITLLGGIGDSYKNWSTDLRIAPILKRFRSRYPSLKDCQNVRLLDFLVWKTGKERLLRNSRD